jgi:hypothetical protein
LKLYILMLFFSKWISTDYKDYGMQFLEKQLILFIPVTLFSYLTSWNGVLIW